MKNRSLRYGLWAKAIGLVFAGLFLTFLLGWGHELRAQTLLIDAVDDTASTAAATPVTINVLANDNTGTSSGGVVNSVTVSGSPGNGNAVVSGNSIIYTPNQGFVGTDTFIYTLSVVFSTPSAPFFQQDTAIVTVTVNPPPLNAVDDTANTSSGTPVTVNVLTNDTGTGLIVTQVTSPANGSAAISGNAVTYTPTAGFAGIDTFTYTIIDSFQQTDTATVTVTVNPPGLNAVDDTASTPSGTPVTVNVLTNDTGTGLIVTQVSTPANGSAAISGNAVTYTPTAGFAGIDTFTYTIIDSFQQTDTATVTVTVNPPGLNAVDDTASTPSGTPVTVNVLTNDTGTGLIVTQVTSPANGSAAISGNAVTYTPTAGFAGIDTFTYTIIDSFQQTDTATVTVTVNPPGLNAVDDTANTSSGTPVTVNVLTNDTGTGLIVTQVTSPANGSAAISGNAVTYTPTAGFAGIDTFTYTIIDSFQQTDTATVTVTVNPPGLNAVDDTASTPSGTPVTVNVLTNDTGTGLIVTQVSTPANGSAAISGNAVTYTPNVNFAGTDTFTYTIRDSFGQLDTATVRITVIAPALEALDDTASTTTGALVAIAVLANDIGTNLTIIQVSNPTHGNAGSGAGGVINYTPTPNFIGTDAFVYTITDGISTDSATVTVEITRGKKDVQKLLEDSTDDPAAKTVGRAIGGLCFDRLASADFLRDCDALVNAAEHNDPNTGSALEQITPKSLTTAVNASQTSVQSQMLGIRTRMAALRTGVMGINIDQLNIQRGGWTLSGQDLRYLFASAGEEIGMLTANEGFKDSGPFGVFVNGTINLGNQDQTENQTGFDFRTLELTLGADYRFSDQFILGAAISYTSINTDIDSNGGSLDTRGLGLTLYGVYYPSDRFYIEGMVSYGQNDYDQQRNVAYQLQNHTDVNQSFDSSYEGHQFFADVGAGYQFTRGNLTFGPETHLSYLDLQVDPFQEQVPNNNNPGSSWAVAIDKQSLESLVFSLGGRASYLFDQSWGTLEPQVELSWLHEFKDNNQVVSGRFVEGAVVPDNIFLIFTDPVDKNYFRFGLGLQARFDQGPSVLIQYRTLFDYKNLEMNTISAQFRWDF